LSDEVIVIPELVVAATDPAFVESNLSCWEKKTSAKY